ncbi:MAG: NUDIX domain-containing protein [Patescibacteria group bacterium]
MEKAVGIFFENDEGEILFLLRNDKSSIPYPNKWDVLGGVVEEGETADPIPKFILP